VRQYIKAGGVQASALETGEETEEAQIQ